MCKGFEGQGPRHCQPPHLGEAGGAVLVLGCEDIPYSECGTELDGTQCLKGVKCHRLQNCREVQGHSHPSGGTKQKSASCNIRGGRGFDPAEKSVPQLGGSLGPGPREIELYLDPKRRSSRSVVDISNGKPMNVIVGSLEVQVKGPGEGGTGITMVDAELVQAATCGQRRIQTPNWPPQRLSPLLPRGWADLNIAEPAGKPERLARNGRHLYEVPGWDAALQLRDLGSTSTARREGIRSMSS